MKTVFPLVASLAIVLTVGAAAQQPEAPRRTSPATRTHHATDRDRGSAANAFAAGAQP